MKKLVRFFFFIVKPPNPVEHNFDGSSKEFNFKKKIFQILNDIIYLENTLSFKIIKLFSLLKSLLIILVFPIYLIPAIILKILNFRILNINYWQIGTYTQQFDLVYKFNDKDYKVFCCIPKNLSSSNFFTSVVKTKFTVIENYFLCLIFLPFFYFNFLKLQNISTDEGFSNNKCFSIFNKQDTSQLYLSHINKLKFEKKLLDDLNLDNMKICSLHIRNLGTIRDSNLDDYFLAVRYLSEIGVTVIRFCEKYSNINEKWKLSNYREILLDQNTKNLQFKIISKSLFMISNNSGPANIATILKIPLLLSNAFPYNKIFNYNEKDITLPKRIKKNNKLLTLDEIINKKYTHAGSEKFFKSENAQIINNTPNEILDSVKEMIKNLESEKIDFKYNKKNYLNIFDYGNGNLSNIFTEKSIR